MSKLSVWFREVFNKPKSYPEETKKVLEGLKEAEAKIVAEESKPITEIVVIPEPTPEPLVVVKVEAPKPAPKPQPKKKVRMFYKDGKRISQYTISGFEVSMAKNFGYVTESDIAKMPKHIAQQFRAGGPVTITENDLRNMRDEDLKQLERAGVTYKDV